VGENAALDPEPIWIWFLSLDSEESGFIFILWTYAAVCDDSNYEFSSWSAVSCFVFWLNRCGRQAPTCKYNLSIARSWSASDPSLGTHFQPKIEEIFSLVLLSSRLQHTATRDGIVGDGGHILQPNYWLNGRRPLETGGCSHAGSNPSVSKCKIHHRVDDSSIQKGTYHTLESTYHTRQFDSNTVYKKQRTLTHWYKYHTWFPNTVVGHILDLLIDNCITLQHTPIRFAACCNARVYLWVQDCSILHHTVCCIATQCKTLGHTWLCVAVYNDIWGGSIKLEASFADYRLFYRALFQKSPMMKSILLTKATPCHRM